MSDLLSRVEGAVLRTAGASAIKALDTPGAASDTGGKNYLQDLLGVGIAFVSGQNDKFKIDTKGSPLKFTAKNELGETATITINGAVDVDLAF